MSAKKLTTIAFLCAIAALASACGRKANLDTPYVAGIEARKEAKEDKKPLPPEPKKPVKDRHFFLDPLI